VCVLVCGGVVLSTPPPTECVGERECMHDLCVCVALAAPQGVVTY